MTSISSRGLKAVFKCSRSSTSSAPDADSSQHPFIVGVDGRQPAKDVEDRPGRA